jgi:hypothetical protein
VPIPDQTPLRFIGATLVLNSRASGHGLPRIRACDHCPALRAGDVNHDHRIPLPHFWRVRDSFENACVARSARFGTLTIELPASRKFPIAVPEDFERPLASPIAIDCKLACARNRNLDLIALFELERLYYSLRQADRQAIVGLDPS